jgi:transposase-like protein
MDIQLKQIEGKIIQIYSESFKRRVIEEYLNSGVPKMDLLRKYGIKTKSGIQRWMKKFGYTDVYKSTGINFTSLTSADLKKKPDSENDNELHKKIRELERQLVEEKLRSEAYARIIDKAEKELKIPIRKKPNTK